LFPRHLRRAGGQQAVGDNQIGEVRGQGIDVPRLHDHPRAKQPDRQQSLAGDAQFGWILFEADDLKIGGPAQLIGKLTRVGVQNETVTFRRVAPVHDLASNLAVQVALRVIAKGIRIVRTTCPFRRGASGGCETVYPALLRTDNQRAAAGGQTHGVSGQVRLPYSPAGLDVHAQDLVQAADKKRFARQDQRTALRNGQIPCVAGIAKLPLRRQAPGREAADLIDPVVDSGLLLSPRLLDIFSQLGKLLSQRFTRLRGGSDLLPRFGVRVAVDGVQTGGRQNVREVAPDHHIQSGEPGEHVSFALAGL